MAREQDEWQDEVYIRRYSQGLETSELVVLCIYMGERSYIYTRCVRRPRGLLVGIRLTDELNSRGFPRVTVSYSSSSSSSECRCVLDANTAATKASGSAVVAGFSTAAPCFVMRLLRIIVAALSLKFSAANLRARLILILHFSSRIRHVSSRARKLLACI